MTPEDEVLIEAMTTAWRPEDPDRVKFHPAFYDLDDEGRRLAFAATAALREMEAALDEDGLSTTARAVLARIRSAE